MEQLKALLILKKDLEELKAKKTLFPRFSFIDDKIILLYEAIAELEAPKTCETCKYSGYFSPHDSLECLNNDCNFYSCDVDLDDGCNKHEPKDPL